VLVVVMEDGLTTGERSLAAGGHGEAVLAMRRQFQRAMEDELTEAVASLTGRQVVAFMSDCHIGPDLVAKLFVLDGSVADAPDGPALVRNGSTS
jgi:uncharacterized protein YbcI